VSYGGKVVVVWVVVGVICPCVETVCWILCIIAVLVQDVAEAAEGGGCVGCVRGVLSLSRDGVLDLVYHIQSRLLFRLSRMLRRLTIVFQFSVSRVAMCNC